MKLPLAPLLQLDLKQCTYSQRYVFQDIYYYILFACFLLSLIFISESWCFSQKLLDEPDTNATIPVELRPTGRVFNRRFHTKIREFENEPESDHESEHEESDGVQSAAEVDADESSAETKLFVVETPAVSQLDDILSETIVDNSVEAPVASAPAKVRPKKLTPVRTLLLRMSSIVRCVIHVRFSNLSSRRRPVFKHSVKILMVLMSLHWLLLLLVVFVVSFPIYNGSHIL